MLDLTGFLWVWLGAGVLAVGLAVGMAVLIDRPAGSQRRAVLDDLRKTLKRLRLAGLDEDALRGFVARNSGRHWEEMYEDLFGFEAKLAMRQTLAAEEGETARPKFAAWREPILARFDRVRQDRQRAKEMKHLKRVETARLAAEGVGAREADEQAEAAAAGMVEQAEVVREAEVEVRRDPEARRPRVNVRDMIAGPKAEWRGPPKSSSRPFHALGKVLFGAKVRFVVAAVLLFGGALWVRQNVKMFEAAAKAVAAVGNVEDAKKLPGAFDALLDPTKFAPLALSDPLEPVGKLFDSFNPLAAGLLLLLSLPLRGIPMAVCFLLSAGMAFLGHHVGVPAVGPLKAQHVSLLGGLILAGVGYALAKRRSE